MLKDPYAVLGVSKDASMDEIKAAYRSMAKKYHPDLHPNDPGAQERMKEINEAYSLLSDPNRRYAGGAGAQAAGGADPWGDARQAGASSWRVYTGGQPGWQWSGAWEPPRRPAQQPSLFRVALRVMGTMMLLRFFASLFRVFLFGWWF